MVRIPRALMDRIHGAALHAFPDEACGLLIGHREGALHVVERVAESENLSSHPDDSFEIDMRLRLRLQKELRGSGREIIGHYHSHPGGPARPSERDRQQAWEPDLVWMIVATEAGKVSGTGAFLLDEALKNFGQMDVDVIPNP